jgi:hypothetical protein
MPFPPYRLSTIMNFNGTPTLSLYIIIIYSYTVEAKSYAEILAKSELRKPYYLRSRIKPFTTFLQFCGLLAACNH